MKMSLNSFVRVRLNDLGHEIHKRKHDELNAGLRNPLAYEPVKENAEGWSEWTLWRLMQLFGPHISQATSVFEEINIDIVLKGQ